MTKVRTTKWIQIVLSGAGGWHTLGEWPSGIFILEEEKDEATVE